jgi:hypothetical protein
MGDMNYTLVMEGDMSHDVEQRISNFLGRKDAEYPELSSISGRQVQRTRKYAAELQNGQLLMTR